MSDYRAKLAEHWNALTKAAQYFNLKTDHKNDIYDSWVLHVGWSFTERHRKVYQAGLVDYYIGMANIDEKERDQPMYHQLMLEIDAFMGFLNQEPPYIPFIIVLTFFIDKICLND